VFGAQQPLSADHHPLVDAGAATTCTLIPWRRCFIESYGPSAALRSVVIRVPSRMTKSSGGGSRRASCRVGARSARRATVSLAYRPAVAVQTPNPAATWAKGSRSCAGAPGPTGTAGSSPACASESSAHTFGSARIRRCRGRRPPRT
jgi:hypothetical protein